MNEQRFIDALSESVKRGKEFGTMTNAELADLLMNKIWATMELFTFESDLIQAVIDRLRGEG